MIVKLQPIKEVLQSSKEREKKEALDITRKVINQGAIRYTPPQLADPFFQKIGMPLVQSINHKIDFAGTVIGLLNALEDDTLEIETDLTQEEVDEVTEGIAAQLKEVKRIYNL